MSEFKVNDHVRIVNQELDSMVPNGTLGIITEIIGTTGWYGVDIIHPADEPLYLSAAFPPRNLMKW
jgi:hypothetical protein